MSEDRERNEQGEYEPTYSDADILKAVEKHEPASTKQVADEVGMVRQSADYRLRKLLEKEAVCKKKIGSSLAWSTSSS